MKNYLRIFLSWVFGEAKTRAQRVADRLQQFGNSVKASALADAYHAFGERVLIAGGMLVSPRTHGGRRAIAGVVALFLTLVVAGAMLMIGYFVIAMIQNAIPTTTLSTAENSNLTSLEGNVSSAFLLAGIALIAIGAGGVIFSLVSSFGFGGGHQ